MEEEPWFTGPQYRYSGAFRNVREHARDGVEIRTTRGASSMKKMNRSVGFIHSSVPAIAVTPFGSSPTILANCASEPCPHASPLLIRLHSARKTTITNTSSPNYYFSISEIAVLGTCTRQTLIQCCRSRMAVESSS